MVKSSREVVDKWKRNLRGATADIEAGVNRVTESPTKLAADNIDKMRTKLMEAFDNGRVEAGLRKVTLEEWKDAFIKVGIGRISAGVEKADSKMVEFMDFLIPHVEAGKGKIKGMPSTSLEDNINRMVEFTRHMASKKYKGR